MTPRYRAWDKEQHRWGEIFFICSEGGLYTPESPFKEDREKTWGYPIARQERFVIMQSTGLKDKNGVEIFEGDVVLWNGWKKIEVSFGSQTVEENFGDIRIFQGFNLYLDGVYPEPVMSTFEVIGNIYENPELLEGEND
ncbi:YopX family protein [Streptococcus hillyeri]|uniref:YopX protein domain-containing protein n=1 Tax=Streptococcus hillyeri TaxID=2282420 RepID=A0A3L9DPV0_9STRE|nr:YopX family protein [Streptococcus hillyeri]RLY02208.1 hypothetical protein EAF07_08135 [Streptococcus hillyeri]